MGHFQVSSLRHLFFGSLVTRLSKIASGIEVTEVCVFPSSPPRIR